VQSYGSQAHRNLAAAISAAFVDAGLTEGPVAAACLGLAGTGCEENRQAVLAWARERQLAVRFDVLTDVELLLAAGTPDGWGLAIVAGTGSIAWARAPDGRTARAGGWGSLLGDEGSGYALGVAALQAVARAADGRGPKTLLTERLRAHFAVATPQELIPIVAAKGKCARCAPLVLAAAAEGDAVARQIIEQGARELALAGASAVRQLAVDVPGVPLVLAGGVLVNTGRYRELVMKELQAAGVKPSPVQVVQEPVTGAVKLAAALVHK
jgi:N-acetylglucosamine kinase-like BadF-type ATPase